MAAHDLTGPQLGEAPFSTRALFGESAVHDWSRDEIERADQERDTNRCQCRVDEVSHAVGQRDVVLRNEAFNAGQQHDAEGRQSVPGWRELNGNRGGEDGDERDEQKARQRRAHAGAVRRALEVLTLHNEDAQENCGEYGRQHAPTSRDVGDDSDRECRDDNEPRAALAASQSAGHHDHADARDGGHRVGRLSHAQGQDHEHSVQTAVQRQ